MTVTYFGRRFFFWSSCRILHPSIRLINGTYPSKLICYIGTSNQSRHVGIELDESVSMEALRQVDLTKLLMSARIGIKPEAGNAQTSLLRLFRQSGGGGNSRDTTVATIPQHRKSPLPAVFQRFRGTLSSPVAEVGPLVESLIVSTT